MKTPRSVHVGIRITPEELRSLEDIVEHENMRCEAAGLPAEVTVSTLLRSWIKEKASQLSMTTPNEPRSRVRTAPNVHAALKKMRRSR